MTAARQRHRRKRWPSHPAARSASTTQFGCTGSAQVFSLVRQGGSSASGRKLLAMMLLASRGPSPSRVILHWLSHYPFLVANCSIPARGNIRISSRESSVAFEGVFGEHVFPGSGRRIIPVQEPPNNRRRKTFRAWRAAFPSTPRRAPGRPEVGIAALPIRIEASAW